MKKTSVYAAALASAAFLFSGCLGTSSSAVSSESETAVLPLAARAAGWHWEYVGSPADLVTFTAFTGNNGWSLDKNDYNGIGYGVTRWQSGRAPLKVQGRLTDIEMMANNQVWGIDRNGWVFKNIDPLSANGGNFTLVSQASAKSIACSNYGDVYITRYSTSTGYQVFKRNPSNNTWVNLNMPLSAIDVDNNGDLYGVRTNNMLYRLPKGIPDPSKPNNGWVLYTLGNEWVDVTAGNGTIYLLSSIAYPPSSQDRFIWTFSTFTGLDPTPIENGLAKHFHADTQGRLWTVSTSRVIGKYTP